MYTIIKARKFTLTNFRINIGYTLSLHLPVTIAVGKHLASFLTVFLI